MKRIIVFVLLAASVQIAAAQEAPTATPIQINLSTLIPPTAAPIIQPSATWTPPAQLGAQLQANESANVRELPDTGAAQLGVIRNGELYPVTGRYFLWYQFQFPTSPNGRGWVFGDLVEIIGDPATIPEIDPNTEPTLPPAVIGATSTAAIVTLTPGGVLTATAESALVLGAGVNPIAAATNPVLPTFTYPPGIIRSVGTPSPFDTSSEASSNSGQSIRAGTGIAADAPLMPIVLLAGLGLLGLAISSLRR